MRLPRFQSRSEPSMHRQSTPTLIVGLDGSETSWDAFWWARGEAERLGGRTVVVFVAPIADQNMTLASCAIVGPLGEYPAVASCIEERIAELRAEVERHGKGASCELEFLLAHGDAAKELLRIAEEMEADLIAVGRSTKRHHHLAGSIGRRLISKHRAPVVVVVP